MVHPIRQLAGDLLHLVLPRVCVACGRTAPDARPICNRCAPAFLDAVAQPFCIRCGASAPIPCDDAGCTRCPEPMPRFASLVRLGDYTGALRSAIQRFKFHRDVVLCDWLAEMLAQRVAEADELADVQVVQPVPLHWMRTWRRGFNQAALLAQGLAGRLKLPVVEALARVRNTAPQVGLSRRQRQQNVRGAFAVRAPRLVAGRTVLLVDDVTTTGATAEEATRRLLDAGARRVRLAVLAKSQRRRFEPAPLALTLRPAAEFA